MTKTKLLIIWFVLLFFLAVRFFFFFGEKPRYKEGDTVSLTTTLASEPRVSGNVQRFEIDGVTIVTSKFPGYHYGEKLTISGKTGKQEGRLLIYFPKIEAKERSTGLAVISNIRQHIINIIQQVLPSTQASLLIGILLGSKEAFSTAFYEALRNTGTLHVVAASGMNISMVASFLVGVFGRIMRRQLAAMVVIAGILFYTALAMFEPSIVRASIMGGLVFTASLFNRQAAAALGLLLAAYFMLFFDPSLLFDIGFQLSFAATAGLLFIKPLLEGRLNKLGWVGEDFKTTVVAQAATLPILLANFGTVSLVSVLVNTLVLWTVPIVMTIGIAGALISFLPFISYFVFLSTLPFLFFFEKVILLFNQPQFLVKIEMPVISIAGYYFLLIAFYLWLRNLWLRNRQLPAEQKSER